MDQQTAMIVAIAVVVAAILLIAAWTYARQRRHRHLRERFGPEYDRTVQAVGTTGKAEAILDARERRVRGFDIRPLGRPQAEAFLREWRRVQTRFVDDPDAAVEEADRLVAQVMTARGYPLEDFDKRADDLSVDHPRVVENYRVARAIAARRERGEAGTEELRQAVVNYRALFEDLLDIKDDTRPRRAS
jgi:hypothetical protein